ncbi:MAG: hypothetical protein V9H69_08205 [Anaerolineae bacterium]
MNEPADPTQEPMEDLQDELRWDELFKRTQPQLSAAARRAQQQMAAGMATPMDYSQL